MNSTNSGAGEEGVRAGGLGGAGAGAGGNGGGDGGVEVVVVGVTTV